MATFYEDARSPIVSELIRQGFEVDECEALRILDIDETAHNTDGAIALGTGAACIAATAGTLALAGFTSPILLPALGIGLCGVSYWNSKITARDRETESQFLQDHPEVLNKVQTKIRTGAARDSIAAAYQQVLRSYRWGDEVPLDRVLGNSQTSNQTQQGIQPIGEAQNNVELPRAKSETLGVSGIQPIGIAQDATTAAAPSSTVVKPGDSIGLDLAAVLLAMPEFCHILLAGENGTGKTTFAMALLKPIIDKFIQINGFELLLIDPKRSRWNGLFQTKSYQSAFSNQPHDLERSVNRLELIYFKLDKLSSDRQKTGKRTEVPTLVIIDEVNTWLDALKAFDRNFKEENSSLPAAERSPAPRLYNRAVDSIAGISRMGREDRVWLWLIGQNSNLEALGLSGAQDRANFSIVAVGLGDNQITIELALSNSTMFTRGQALKNALKEHQGKPYQIAACTRKPANLLIMPSSYKDNAQEDFSPEILARLGAPSSTTIAPPSSSIEKLEALYQAPSAIETHVEPVPEKSHPLKEKFDRLETLLDGQESIGIRDISRALHCTSDEAQQLAQMFCLSQKLRYRFTQITKPNGTVSKSINRV